MKISFIIPAKNEAKLIGNCLYSIRRACEECNIYADFEYEIIVVDNESTDHTPHIARAHNSPIIKKHDFLGTVSVQNIISVHTSDAKSIAGVRNAGAKEAVGDYLIFVDADSRINSKLLRETLEALKINIGGGCALKIQDPSSVLSKPLCALWNKVCKRKKWFTGSYIFVKREFFFRIGGFTEFLFLCEDVSFSKSLNFYSAFDTTKYIDNAFVYTSDRKLKMFSFLEHVKFWFNLFKNPTKVVTNRDQCNLWYDIRR